MLEIMLHLDGPTFAVLCWFWCPPSLKHPIHVMDTILWISGFFSELGGKWLGEVSGGMHAELGTIAQKFISVCFCGGLGFPKL